MTDPLHLAIAQGFHLAGLSLASLVIAFRLWTYSPPVDPETFNERRYSLRLCSVPFWTAFIYTSGMIYAGW